MLDHPDWRLGGERYQGRDALDFGRDEVRDYTARFIEEAVRRYDCDGTELDFNRFPRFFKDGTADERTAKMNSLVERVRNMLDAVGRARGRRLVLGVRAPSNFGHTPPTPDTARQIGCGVPGWARNGWIDYVAVSEFLFERGDLPIGQWRQAIPRSRSMAASSARGAAARRTFPRTNTVMRPCASWNKGRTASTCSTSSPPARKARTLMSRHLQCCAIWGSRLELNDTYDEITPNPERSPQTARIQ